MRPFSFAALAARLSRQRLPVRRKLQLLLAGSLAVALLLVAGMLTWLVDRDHEQRASREAHTMLRDVGRRLAEIEQQLLTSALALARREETIASIALLTDYATPDNYQPLIFDEEKKRLVRDLLHYASSNLPTEAVIYDGSGLLLALVQKSRQQGTLSAINLFSDGRYHLLGSTHTPPDWQPVSLPASIPEDVAGLGTPPKPMVQLRRQERTLLIEAIAPVIRQRGDAEQIVGWIRVALPYQESGLVELAHLRGMRLDLLFSGSFDTANRHALTAQAFADAPPLADMPLTHAQTDGPVNRARAFFDAAALPLAQGEQAWLLAMADHERLQTEQALTRWVALGVFATTLLAVVPLMGWLGRRWISAPLERVREGVHAFTQGQQETHIDMPPGDEIGQLAEDFNILAVTMRVREIAIKESEERLHAMIEAIGEAIMVTDPQGIIKRVNPAFSLITGFSADEVLGQTPRFLNSGRHEPSYFETMWQQLMSNGYWEGETWNRRKNGEIFPVWQVITSVKDSQGQLIEFISLFHDITQRKRSEAEIAYRANYDALTGLPNRALLAERLNQSLKQARRENSRVAVLFIDLDLFKRVNDTLGHAVGDALLQAVAERMRLCVRETDTIARQGGDEFVVLLVDIEGSSAAGIVAEKIISLLAAPFDLSGNEIHIGASIGITLFPEDGVDVETLFRNADLAMYRAKDAGRNNAQFFERAMTTAALERRTLEADLRNATARHELELHYQPIIDLPSGQVTGAEALLRWNHPQRGRIGPDQFIPLAEESGLIREIGTWVFEEACTQLAAWQQAGHHLNLAINVSVRQLPDALSVTQILTVLARHGLSPRQIVLEITEGVLLADAPAIQAWFNDAGAAGLQLAIDDFGTGYSSLSYLKRFPVHHVKIDKAFVRDMASDLADLALVDAILAMAKSLGLSVVAEGVETSEQAELLRARDCALAQGFLYGHPVSAAEFGMHLTAPPSPISAERPQ